MTAAPADFRALYEAELAYVVRTLRRLGVAAADLEDSAHDVFATAYRRRDDRDPARPVKPWLFGIAYRVVGNYRQKAHRTREVAADPGVDAEDPRPDPERAAGARELGERLLAELAALDLEHRAVAILYFLDGVPAPAIAEAIGIPLDTVYSRARAARRTLLDRTRDLRGEP
jgi:RNA polymerase sigma-70 factor, ECF subfamily